MTTTPARIPANVRKVLTAIRDGQSWRGSNQSVEFILANGLAYFHEGGPAEKGWRLTPAGEGVVGG